MRRALLAAVMLLLITAIARAHSPGLSDGRIRIFEDRVEVMIRIEVADLGVMLAPYNTDEDYRNISAAELKNAETEVFSGISKALQVRSKGSTGTIVLRSLWLGPKGKAANILYDIYYAASIDAVEIDGSLTETTFEAHKNEMTIEMDDRVIGHRFSKEAPVITVLRNPPTDWHAWIADPVHAVGVIAAIVFLLWLPVSLLRKRGPGQAVER